MMDEDVQTNECEDMVCVGLASIGKDIDNE